MWQGGVRGRADGTHPTGMHSCFKNFVTFILLNIIETFISIKIIL